LTLDSSPVPARRQIAERLLDPSRPGVESVETHVSTIVFDGDLVHKRKKPVRFAFIDLSTPEKREQTCHREIELNRRFSPDVYLGVEDVVNDAGEVVDHAVLMRRMPADRRLAVLVRRHVDVSDCLRAVARIIAVSHAEAARSEEISSVATPETLRELWAQNLREMAPFVPHLLDSAIVADIGELARRYLDGRATLLRDRVERGLVVDGHGDLMAEDIFCLDDGPRVLDGLEFDARLRWGDVLYDVGFLAMDLERLGHLELALAFLSWYREFSAETHPSSLEHHYVAYRALVRAKISCLKGGVVDVVEAQAYLAQCRRHLLDARVQLVVVGGLPGTGKTTLAAALGDELGWTVLRSDEMRKELAGLDPLTHAPAAYGKGLYSPESTELTYDALLSRVRELVARGESVVIDASFSRSLWRTAAAAVAVDTFSDLTELCCVLPLDVAAARLARRQAEGGDASDATPAVAAEMAEEFDAWPNAATIDTLPPLEDVLPAVVDRIRAPHRRRTTSKPQSP
jgi:aminoglycoside phosphotransferase family enzyme/predicted kinase